MLKRKRDVALPYKSSKKNSNKRRNMNRNYNYRPTPTLRSTGPEKKTFDLNPGASQANTTGFLQCICIPSLGTDYTNRIGRKITVKSIFIRGYVRTEVSASLGAVNVSSQMVRVIVLLDEQPNGGLPAVTDVLQTSDPAAQLNLNNRDRFRVLKDKTWTFDPYLAGSTASRQIYPFKWYLKCNIDTLFNAVNGGTIADITSGSILTLVVGSNGAGVNTDANAYFSTRCRFLDM